MPERFGTMLGMFRGLVGRLVALMREVDHGIVVGRGHEPSAKDVRTGYPDSRVRRGTHRRCREGSKESLHHP